MGIMSLFFNPGDRGQKKSTVISAIMVVFTSFYTIMYTMHMPFLDGAGFGTAGLVYALRYIPIMLTAALGGAIPGMLSVLIVFIFRSVTSSTFSYMTFIYLLVVIVLDLITRRRWFDKWYKALAVSFYMQNLVGTFWGIILMLLSDTGIYVVSIKQVLLFFLNELPGCLLGSMLIYTVFRRLPDKTKLLFNNGIYYVDPKILSEDQKYEIRGRSRIGNVVMNVIVLEALILGISAEFASSTLIPTMKDYWMIAQEGAEIDEELGLLGSTERVESRVSRQLIEESGSEQGYLTGRIIPGNFRINYRYSVRLAMLISIIVIPLAVFMNRYAQLRIARPIRMLSSAMSDIYNGGESRLNESIKGVHDLDIRTKDEIEDLYRTVDMTVYRLMDYIELAKSRQAIEDQLEIAKSANEAKSRFLSNISHEIRTPINAVLGFDEMILRESRDEEILDYATDIQNSGRTLLALINDILDFSKIEAGKMEIVPVEYELGSLMNDIVNMSQVRAKEKNLRLIVDVDQNIPHILFGDEIRIKQCIINIVTNAVKYTEEGSVTLSVSYENVETDDSEDEDENEDYILLKVSVKDTGIGIRQEDMHRLTSAFERIDMQRNRTIEGSGLGISIVTNLLELMGSKLEAESEYGKGSVFSFAVKQHVVNWDRVGDFAGKVRESGSNRKGYRERFHAQNASILVVDDTRTNLTVIEGLLKQTLIRIDTATSGVEALELVRNNRYNIIFLDHRMPEMDGIQTFHAMEEIEDNPNRDTPVIALTANAISGSREMYVREGFTNYMSKPVDPAKLEDMILEYLPAELVTRLGDTDFAAGAEDDEKDKEKAVMQELLKISGIDMTTAVQRCGSAVAAKDVMKDFYLSIEERSGLIENFEASRNIKDYTIYVHGLKSSARAVGALDLAERAEYLEMCGNNGNLADIEALTPPLLALYRSYLKKLEPLFAGDDSGKELISSEELEGAFASIREFVSASYFDSADDIIQMLENYRIPDEQKKKYAEVKRLLSAVDRDGLLNIL